MSGYLGTRVPGGPGSGPLKSRVTSPSPTSRIWRIPVRGGYPAGGTLRLQDSPVVRRKKEAAAAEDDRVSDSDPMRYTGRRVTNTRFPFLPTLGEYFAGSTRGISTFFCKTYYGEGGEIRTRDPQPMSCRRRYLWR